MDMRDRILTVARELFLEHGFEGVSMNRVLEEAGASKGALYHHFVSKQALFEEIILNFFRSSETMMWQYLESQRDIDDAFKNITAFLDAYETWFYREVGGQQRAHRYFRLLLDGVRLSPGLRERISVSLRSLVGWLASVIDRAKDDGKVHQDIDSAVTAFQIMATLEGMFFLGAVDPTLDISTYKVVIFDNLHRLLRGGSQEVSS